MDSEAGGCTGAKQVEVEIGIDEADKIGRSSIRWTTENVVTKRSHRNSCESPTRIRKYINFFFFLVSVQCLAESSHVKDNGRPCLVCTNVQGKRRMETMWRRGEGSDDWVLNRAARFRPPDSAVNVMEI